MTWHQLYKLECSLRHNVINMHKLFFISAHLHYLWETLQWSFFSWPKSLAQCIIHTSDYLRYLTHLFNGPFSRTTQMSLYQIGKTNLDFTEARDFSTFSVTSGPYASLHLAPDRWPCQHLTAVFLQAGCPSCRLTNSVKELKAKFTLSQKKINYTSLATPPENVTTLTREMQNF